MKRTTLTPSLSKRIIRDVREGVPPQVAARKAGVPVERFLDWMSRPARKYKLFQQALDQAVAVATAENVLLLKRAAKRGKYSAALRWLQSQAPEHFPAKAPVSLTQNVTLIEQIKLMESREGEIPDPRRTLDAAEEQAALPPAQETVTPDERDERPDARVYEAVGFTATRPDVIDLAPIAP